MALKVKVTADEHGALADALKALYTKQADGSYLLDAEGVEDVSGLKTALSTERQARAAAEKAARDEAAKYTGVDVEAYRKWLADGEANAETKLIKEGKFEEAIAKRTEKMRRDHESQIAALQADIKKFTDQATSLQSQLGDTLINAAIAQTAPKTGIRSTAINDLTRRAKDVWKVEDGKLVPYKDGTIYYGKTGGKPIEVEEWIASLTSEAPHLFEPNRGTNTPANGAQQVGNTLKITREQARDASVYKDSKAQAEKAGLQLQIVD